MSRRHPLRQPGPQVRSQAQSNIKDLVTTPTYSVGNCLRRDLTSSWTSSSSLPSSPSSSLSLPSSPCCPPVSEMALIEMCGPRIEPHLIPIHQQNEKDTLALKEVLTFEPLEERCACERSRSECARTSSPASSQALLIRCGKLKLALRRTDFLNHKFNRTSTMQKPARRALTKSTIFRRLRVAKIGNKKIFGDDGVCASLL